MDGDMVTALTITASVNIVAVISLIYYLKGKIEGIEKRIDDIYKHVDSIMNMLNTRIKNIEEIIYREYEGGYNECKYNS